MSTYSILNDLDKMADQVQCLIDELNHLVEQKEATDSLVSLTK